MADGKQKIYLGPADRNDPKPLQIEGVSVGTPLPGTVLKQTASGLDVDDRAASVFTGGELIVADKDSLRQKAITDAWVVDENMQAIRVRAGEFLNVLVADAQVLVQGTGLARNAAGLLVVAATDGNEEIVAISDEALTTSGTTLVRVYKP